MCYTALMQINIQVTIPDNLASEPTVEITKHANTCAHGCGSFNDQPELDKHIEVIPSSEPTVQNKKPGVLTNCPYLCGNFNTPAELQKHIDGHNNNRDPSQTQKVAFSGSLPTELNKHATKDCHLQACIGCSDTFIPVRSTQIYCSDKCGKQYRNRGRVASSPDKIAPSTLRGFSVPTSKDPFYLKKLEEAKKKNPLTYRGFSTK